MPCPNAPAQGLCSYCHSLVSWEPSLIPPGVEPQGIICLECFRAALAQGLVSKVIFPTKAFEEFINSIKNN